MTKSIRWAAIAACLFLASQVSAQQWPSRLIKATIPFGAGSATDVVPRLVFDRLAAELGQSIVIENRVGAGGTVGTAMVAKADPDGYTVLAHSSALTIAPAIFPDLTFDATKDLSSVLMIGSSANVMIVPDDAAVEDGAGFHRGRQSQSPARFRSARSASAARCISAPRNSALPPASRRTHVPYRGGAEVIADILGGRIDFYFCPLATALPLIHDGKVRALVVSAPTRVADLPDVPDAAPSSA